MISNISELSVGQKQLLCVARIVLRRNRVVVLDEPTANVDNETDNLMQNILREKFREKTVLCIAHRISSIIESDKILVVSEG